MGLPPQLNYLLSSENLSRREGLTILPADKGNTTVVMDSTQYASNLGDLLAEDSYRLLPRNPTARIENWVTDALKSVEKDGNLSEQARKKLTPRQSTVPQIYGLPKIHKTDVPLRPIVYTIGSPTCGLAKELARILTPLSGRTSSFVRNSAHFVEKIS